MKKKLLTLLLSIAVILTSTVTIFAVEEHNHTGWTNWGDDTSEQTSLPSGEGNYFLTHDVSISSTWNVSGTINLCLNGYVINASSANSKAINVAVGATLNLYDCGTTTHNGYIDTSGLWHLDETNSHSLITGEIALPITGGIITGGNSDTDGGGIINYGTLTMNGGNIAGCKAIKCGGGVFNKGTFIMNGGSIKGCITTSTESKQGLGGGVFNSDDCTFNFSGGTIEYNTTARFGGAVSNSEGGTFTMTAGLIQNNKAIKGGGGINSDGDVTITGGTIAYNIACTEGGGVRLSADAKTLTIYDATITNNTAVTKAGGVYIKCSAILGKGTKITDNTVSGNANNLYLSTGKTITLGSGANAPTEMNVGVSLETNTGKFATNCADDDKSYFFSDNENYRINFNTGTDVTGDEYLELKAITIADILPDGFPTSNSSTAPDNAWVSGNKKIFLDNSSLDVVVNETNQGSVAQKNSEITKNGNTYVFDPQYGPTLTFNMSEGDNPILQSITITEDEIYNGIYYPPTPIAQIGDTEYLTLQDAINAVQNNETIILLGDVTTDSTFNIDGKTFAIDLKNYKITTSAVTGFDINSANLTVKNGTVINNNTSGLSGSSMETRTKAFFLEKEGQGSLTLDGVKIESTGYSVNVNNNNNSNGAKNKTVVIKDSDLSSATWCTVYANSVDGSNELTITNSNIHSSWTGTNMAALQICMKTTIEKTTVTNNYGAAVGCFENTDLLVKGTENSFVGAGGSISTNGSKDLVQITIEGGEFKTTGTTKEAGIAFYHPDGSPLTIKGGTFEGATALYVKGGTIDIQGGSFTGTGNYEAAQKVTSGAHATGDAVVIEASGYLAGENYNPDPNPSVSISGGLFKSTNGSPIAYYTFDGNKEAHEGKMVSGGVLNKKIYDVYDILVEGKSHVANTDKNTSAEYPYMIGNNTAEIEVETDNKENVVPTYQDETKNHIAIKLSRTNIDLDPEALTVAADGNIVNESLEAKAKEVTGFTAGDDLTITIRTYLDMSVEKANITDTVGSEDNTFSVDITPKYVVVAKVNSEEEKVVSEGKDLSVTRTVPLKIYLPAGFANYHDKVWIKHHLKDGSSVVYGGEDGLQVELEFIDLYVEFENPDGFSVFDVYLKKVSPDPKPTPTPKPRYIVPNTGVEGIPTNNNSLLKISSLSLLAIGICLVIKKKKDND